LSACHLRELQTIPSNFKLKGGMEMDWLIISAIGTIGLFGIALLKLWLQIKSEKQKGESERATTKQMLDHLNALRRNIEANRKAIKKLEKSIDNQITPKVATAIDERKTALKEEELRLKKEKQEWKKLTDIAKGIGWAIKRMKEE